MNDNDEKNKRFMSLFLKIQRRLYGYIMAIIPNPIEVDDIIQEVAALMWAKFDEFKPGSDFAAWALTIAQFKVKQYFSNKKKHAMRFSDKAVEILGSLESSAAEREDKHLDALPKCIQKLPEEDRLLLSLRYQVGASLKSVAERLDKNINTIYSRLSRVHILLLNCIQRYLTE